MIYQNNKLKKVTYYDKDYFLGLDYLSVNQPNNPHIKSCYEGISFRSLAQHILLEKDRVVFKSNKYLKRPDRYILYSDSGAIIGVMIRVSLPEFFKEIDYEDYVIISADSPSDYSILLDQLSFSGRAEIVTFNNDQVNLVKTKFLVKEIHYWSVFFHEKELNCVNNIDIRLMGKDDVKMAAKISEKTTEVLFPSNSLKLQLAGLSYKNYVISSGNRVLVYMGISYYSMGFYKIDYLVNLTNDSKNLSLAADKVSGLAEILGCKLIWRIKREDVNKNMSLIKKLNFVEFSKEKHLHLS